METEYFFSLEELKEQQPCADSIIHTVLSESKQYDLAIIEIVIYNQAVIEIGQDIAEFTDPITIHFTNERAAFNKYAGKVLTQSHYTEGKELLRWESRYLGAMTLIQ